MSGVWKGSVHSGGPLLVLLAIADFANDEGVAYPSIETLAKKSRLSERSVQYAITALRESGELDVKYGAGPHGSNVYQVRVQILRGANSAGVQNTADRGEASCTQTISEPSPNKKSAQAKSSASRPASQISNSFAPDDTGLSLAASLGVSVQEELPRFIDHHRAKGSLMKDWQAAWRTWTRNAEKFTRERKAQSHGKQSKHERDADFIASITGKNRKPSYINGEFAKVD